jgi:hypothetical protein
MKRPLQALAVLFALGIAKLPLEQACTQHLRQAKLLTAPLALGLRENLSQMGFAASLGGLRSLVASITYLQAYHEWENVNWAKVDSLLQLTTSLQPGYCNYWDDASWQMAYNAASYYLYDEKLQPIVRGKLYEEHVRRGIAILKEGLRYLPDDARLWNSLAEIYERRSHEPEFAAEAYLQVYRLSQNNRYWRFAAYQFAQSATPALWQRAYSMLRESYHSPKQRTPSLIDTIKKLEAKLNIPFPQRIPDTNPPMQLPATEAGPIR